MKYPALLILITLLLACGPPRIQSARKPASVAPILAPAPPARSLDYGEFQPIIDEFNSYSPKRVDSLIVFNNLKLPVIGQCSTPENVIELDPTWWAKHKSDDHSALLLHELGHCILHLDHNNSLFPDTRHVSIMHYQVTEGFIFNAHRDYYLRELVGLPQHEDFL